MVIRDGEMPCKTFPNMDTEPAMQTTLDNPFRRHRKITVIGEFPRPVDSRIPSKNVR